MDFISLQETLKTMEQVDKNNNHIPFAITFVTYNRHKNEGGEKIKIDKAILYKQPHIKQPEKSEAKPKQPAHYENSTRNIQIVSSGQIRKIHIRLITDFNGKRVYY